jgi:Putative Ig domain
VEWLLWIILAIVVVAAAMFLLKANLDGARDDSAMPIGSRRFLVAYLLSIVVVLAYLLVKLSSVTFSEGRCAPSVAAPEKSADKGIPVIERLRPSCVIAGSSLPSLVVDGHHFTDQTTVRVNGLERDGQAHGEDTALVTLRPSDLANPGTLWIEITSNGKRSIAADFQVLSPSEVRSEVSLFGRAYRIDPEMRLVLLVLVAGALGSYIHAIKSLADFIGNRTLMTSWFWWYVTRPFLGMPLAFIFYAALRGGFLVGTPADVKAVSPFGAFTVAALVGMFADKASQKLGELFETLFRTDDTRKDKLAPSPVIKTLQPASAAAGAASLTLEILGENLGATKFVRVNSEDRAPDTVGANKVSVKLRPEDIAKSGKLNISVTGDQGTSSALTLYITDLTISTAMLPAASTKAPYQEKLMANGGVAPLSWEVEGLPKGLQCSKDGELAGTSAEAGVKTLTVRVKDSTGAQVSKALKLEVTP